MDRTFTFRADQKFLQTLAAAAKARGVPVSRLIREAVVRDITAKAA